MPQPQLSIRDDRGQLGIGKRRVQAHRPSALTTLPFDDTQLSHLSINNSFIAATRKARFVHHGYWQQFCTSSSHQVCQEQELHSRLNNLVNKLCRLREPISAVHLRRVRDCMDLQNSQKHRTLWALWLSQWHGVLRSGDLIRSKACDVSSEWRPDFDTHVGRLSTEFVRTEENRELLRFVLCLKPHKSNKLGAKALFTVDPDDPLSAGSAIKHMLTNRGREADPSQSPLFLDPDTKSEITWIESSRCLSSLLAKAGVKQSPHLRYSLRSGGATVYAHSTLGRYVMASLMNAGKCSADNRLCKKRQDKEAETQVGNFVVPIRD